MEEEEEMFTPSECSSECSSELEEMFNAPSEMPEEQSVTELAHDDVGIKEMLCGYSTSSPRSSELEEMFNAPSEMPEEQSVTELAHDDVGIIEKSSVSPKNREGMPTGSGILDEYSTSSPSVDNRLPEANIADEISPPPHAVEPLSPEASKDSEDLNQLDILKGPTDHDDVGIKEMLYGCSTSPLVDNRLPEANIADKPLSPEASKGSEDLNQLDIQKGQTAVAEGPLFQIMKIVSDQENEVEECKHLAGHEGNHDCKMKNHTCAEICSLFDKSSNCSKSCCLTVGHEGTHKCNSSQHLCNMKCSLPSCKNPCVIQIELGDHDKHACHERFCPNDCIMKAQGCPRSCGYKDHFHELTSDEHLCGEKHGCPKECEADGICEILTELVRHTRSFQGRRGSFEYIHLSEQNGKKKNCCIDIPPFKTSHDGVHLHTQNPDVVHHCNARCQACGYFCSEPIDHTGLHNTVHGNMRNVNFASDQKEFDIQGRKYAWGESGVAEMCNLHCKAQGRGHIHLIPCPMNDGLPCTRHIYDGSRHETRKYGPDLDVPKDELTHKTYWMQMRFEDPCTKEDQEEFALCNHLCGSEEHKDTDGSSTKSYCAEELWHAPVQRTSTPSSGGHITADGHRFRCDHLKNVPHHVVFVIDRSGSMYASDIRPNLAKCIPRHNCRLGCVYESIDRFIKTRLRTSSDDSVSVVLFDDTATLALERQEMKEDIVDGLLQYDAGGATSYSSGLTMAEEVICRGSNDPNVEKKKPIIIFLSDGGNNDGQDPLFFVNKLKKTEPKLILHTIMYGTDPAALILEKMAEIGNGTFQVSLDELQLARSFENLAISLEPNVVSVITVSRSNP